MASLCKVKTTPPHYICTFLNPHLSIIPIMSTTRNTTTILALARETRQRIYDYIFNPAGTQTLTIHLTPHSHLRVHNGPSIANTVRSHRTFALELPPYLFQHITFILSDRNRTCLPLLNEFFTRMGPSNRARITKMAIPYLTIRGLFEPQQLAPPFEFHGPD